VAGDDGATAAAVMTVARITTMTTPITAGKDDAPLDDGRRKRIRRMCNDVVGYQSISLSFFDRCTLRKIHDEANTQ
jgi:hypothetical protein